MKRIFQYILMATVLSMVSFSLFSCKEEGIIEEADMSQIYAEMLMTDQWINSVPNLRRVADTSLVYEPILRKYGYNSEDYRRSVEYYLNDPDEYADIMKETVKILDQKLVELNKRSEIKAIEKAAAEYIKEVSRSFVISDSWRYMELLEDEKFGELDSLVFVWDTLALYYSIEPVPWGENLELTDSLAVADTITPLDTLSVLDHLPQLDTIAKIDTIRKQEIVKGVKPNIYKRNLSLKVNDSLPKIHKVWE